MHKNGVIHRDLRPEHCLFANNNKNKNNYYDLKILGFEKSVIKKNKQEHFKQVKGSLYYNSPEVLDGNYDEKSDIWAIGCICYLLLCG